MRLMRCAVRAQKSNVAFPALCAVILTSPLPSALRCAPKPMAPDGGDEERDAEERRVDVLEERSGVRKSWSSEDSATRSGSEHRI
eukprot:8188949-Pyramimonas_sp.AAC.1